MMTPQVNCAEYTDEQGEQVLHLLFEDGAQQVVKKSDKSAVYDSGKDALVPDRLLKDGEDPIHEFFGVPLLKEAQKAAIAAAKAAKKAAKEAALVGAGKGKPV